MVVLTRATLDYYHRQNNTYAKCVQAMYGRITAGITRLLLHVK